MSELIDIGLSPAQASKLLLNIELISKVNVLKESSCTEALQAWEQAVKILASKLSTMNHITAFCQSKLDLKIKRCDATGNHYPEKLVVLTPDNTCIRADYLFSPAGAWEYCDDKGTIIKSARLYGDKDILAWNANPLDYLKFKCLPDEKLQYNIKVDECCDTEYNGNAPVFLGIELEVEKKESTPHKIERMVASELGMDYIVLKHDGSLQNGFEIVTAPATLRYHLQAWDKFFNKETGCARHVTSWASGRCGMHVHVGRKAITPLHLGKIIAFVNNVENRDFITTIAGRGESPYAMFNINRRFHSKTNLVSLIAPLKEKELKLQKKLSLAKDKTIIAGELALLRAEIEKIRTKVAKEGNCLSLLQDLDKGGDRRSAINLTKAGTIEFRIFRGNVSKIGMFKNLEFVDAVVNFTREATFRTQVLTKEELEERKLKRKENTDYCLHHSYFVDWLSKDNSGNYNNLKLWLQTHKITDKFSRRKPSKYAPPKCNERITDTEIRECA